MRPAAGAGGGAARAARGRREPDQPRRPGVPHVRRRARRGARRARRPAGGRRSPPPGAARPGRGDAPDALAGAAGDAAERRRARRDCSPSCASSRRTCGRRSAPAATPANLRRRRVDLERAIRDHTRRARAAGDAMSVGVGDAIAALGDHALLEYAAVDGQLYAVSVVGGRARLHELGSDAGLADDVDACAFAIHRLNRVQGSAASKAAARATLDELGQRLADRIVPTRVRRSERPLVVVPTGALHGLAWSALPGLSGRPVSVSPSLIGWAVARRATESPGRSTRRPARRRAGPAGRAGGGRGPRQPVPPADRAPRRRRHRRRRVAGPRAEPPRPPRLPWLVPGRQPAVLDVGARRRPAHGVRPGALPDDAAARSCCRRAASPRRPCSAAARCSDWRAR